MDNLKIYIFQINLTSGQISYKNYWADNLTIIALTSVIFWVMNACQGGMSMTNEQRQQIKMLRYQGVGYGKIEGYREIRLGTIV